MFAKLNQVHEENLSFRAQDVGSFSSLQKCRGYAVSSSFCNDENDLTDKSEARVSSWIWFRAVPL